MPTVANYRLMASYNRWMNCKLYDAAARLTDAEYRRDHGAFFKSIHGTLNHLLAGVDPGNTDIVAMPEIQKAIPL